MPDDVVVAAEPPTNSSLEIAAQAAAPIVLSDARPGLAVPAAMPSPGEYLLASLSRDPARTGEMSRRIRAAAPHTFLADVPGLIPSQIVGPVLHLRDGSAPVYNALGPLTAPDGGSFSIPLVSPELVAATGGTEKSDKTAQFGVIKVVVAMEFIKVAVNISAEAVAWSQPSVLDVAVTELAESLALGSDKAVIAKLEAATGTNAAVSIAVNGADAWAKLAGAVMTQYGASGAYPDRFIAAPDVWAKLAGFTNISGVPLIVGVDQNLSGVFGSLFGIPVVVSPQITAGKSFLVSSRGVKSWTNGSVTMRVEEPTILGYALGAGRGVGLSVASGKFITPVSIAAAE